MPACSHHSLALLSPSSPDSRRAFLSPTLPHSLFIFRAWLFGLRLQALRPGVSGPISTRSEPPSAQRCLSPVTRGAALHSAPPRPLGTAAAPSGRAEEPKALPPTPRNPCALDKDSVSLPVSPFTSPRERRLPYPGGSQPNSAGQTRSNGAC
ncbi:hypothetical protein B0H14DRAFT_3765486 [Mycena olivaceomarginata]|nr:hypothetical protein B0H14DRAFT_3765486 [Mycena olivaceomarginata]